MSLFAFGSFTLFLAFIWGMFFVARINFFKFRQYSPVVVPMTRLLTIVLLVGSVLGYLLLARYFMFGGGVSSMSNDENSTADTMQVF